MSRWLAFGKRFTTFVYPSTCPSNHLPVRPSILPSFHPHNWFIFPGEKSEMLELCVHQNRLSVPPSSHPVFGSSSTSTHSLPSMSIELLLGSVHNNSSSFSRAWCEIQSQVSWVPILISTLTRLRILDKSRSLSVPQPPQLQRKWWWHWSQGVVSLDMRMSVEGWSLG